MQIPSECPVAEDLSWGVATLVVVMLMVPLLPVYAVMVAADRVRGVLCRDR